MNGDSFCCTRVSIESGALPLTTSFMWISSCWIPLNLYSHDCSSILCLEGVGSSFPRSSVRVTLLCSPLRAKCGPFPLAWLDSSFASRGGSRCDCSS